MLKENFDAKNRVNSKQEELNSVLEKKKVFEKKLEDLYNLLEK